MSTLLRVHPRSDGERSLPSGGWAHWLLRARDVGLITEAEHGAWQKLPHATLTRMEVEVEDEGRRANRCEPVQQ